MTANAIPRGWIEIGDTQFRLDQVVAVQPGHEVDCGSGTLIVFAGGGSIVVWSRCVPADFLARVAKSQRRSVE